MVNISIVLVADHEQLCLEELGHKGEELDHKGEELGHKGEELG